MRTKLLKGAKSSAASRQGNSARSGAAAVEFALIAPLFFLLLGGIIEFGQAMSVRHSLSVAARRGARAAIVEGASTASVTEKVKSDCKKVFRAQEEEFRVAVAINGSRGTDLKAAQSGDEITLTVSVPYSVVGIRFYGNLLNHSLISTSCTFEHE